LECRGAARMNPPRRYLAALKMDYLSAYIPIWFAADHRRSLPRHRCAGHRLGPAHHQRTRKRRSSAARDTAPSISALGELTWWRCLIVFDIESVFIYPGARPARPSGRGRAWFATSRCSRYGHPAIAVLVWPRARWSSARERDPAPPSRLKPRNVPQSRARGRVRTSPTLSPRWREHRLFERTSPTRSAGRGKNSIFQYPLSPPAADGYMSRDGGAVRHRRFAAEFPPLHPRQPTSS